MTNLAIPEIVPISRLVQMAPSVRSEPLVGLAHRDLLSASDEELFAHVQCLFDACWAAGLSPSEALSLVWGSNVGWVCRFRKLTPSILWQRCGLPGHEALSSPRPERSEPQPATEWWGSRFELWAADVAPEIPVSFRRATGWSLLSLLVGERTATPLGQSHITVSLAGANIRTRDDARKLGGASPLPMQSVSLASLLPVPDRLTATVPDDVITAAALRERQGPPEHGADPAFTLLVSQALDGFERAQAAAGGPLVVKSSEEALGQVTSLRTSLAARTRTLDPDTMDRVLSGSALLARKMAALVAVTEGANLVTEIHQSIAIDGASESVSSLVRFLTTDRWLARQA